MARSAFLRLHFLTMTESKTLQRSQVIELDRLQALDHFPAYVAIYSPVVSKNPFVFSPSAMQWSDNIVLNRVKECETFWRVQKNKQCCDYDALFLPLLSHHFGEDFIAVFGLHPWQCLLYLSYLLQQQSRGIYFLQSRLNRHIYQTHDWQVWFSNQAVLAIHLESIRVKGFNRGKFHARQARLQRFIHRIGMDGPFDLPEMKYQAFSRRFGVWLANCWRWTLQQDDDLNDFPWIKLEQALLPSVKRDLEYPVNQWQVVEVLLREDLQRLNSLFVQDRHQHINSMAWQIKLFNQQTVVVELEFRHPYSLHQDAPEFDTALYQARYIYESLIGDLQARNTDLDLPETMPLIAWKIEIGEYFDLPPLIWDMFADHLNELVQDDIFNLQNKLPINIESFEIDHSFIPENSFVELSHRDHRDHDFDQDLWRRQSLQRPLFSYPSALPVELADNSHFTFLERCANLWWQADNTSATNRDYYLMEDKRGRASWVYRDFDGKWFKQGEYC